MAHILALSVPAAVGSFTQMACHVVDLYFVAEIGVQATAGMNAAGNVAFVFSALAQMLGVGTTALISHAVGRGDQYDANGILNQGFIAAIVCGAGAWLFVWSLMGAYLGSTAADVVTAEAGASYLNWVLPGYALTLPVTVLGAALRGAGAVLPTIVLSILTVLLNGVLAPILISGWLTNVPLGVKGAGLATSVSIAVGLVIFVALFDRMQNYLSIQPMVVKPSIGQWRRILVIGGPAAGEFAIAFLYLLLVYHIIREFGAAAQAGFGVGLRITQLLLVPGMAIGFAAGPIAGQNYGAENDLRVRETFDKAMFMGGGLMVIVTVFAQWQAPEMASMFYTDLDGSSVAVSFVKTTSWAFAAQFLVYTCSGMFQSLGNTVPSIVSSFGQLILFAVPILCLSAQPTFRIEQIWYVTIGAILLQAALSLWMLRVEFRRKLVPRGALLGA